MRGNSFFTIALFFISIASLYAQDAKLEVVCFALTSNSDPISSAQAVLYEDGSQIKTINTDSKGKISFALDYNKDYKIIISKKGMIQKRIDFKTNVATENQRNLRKEFAMTLVEHCEGADVSVFKEPADIITYDEGFGNFVSDQVYFEKMQSRFANGYENIEKCKEDNFQDNKAKADQLFSQGEYEEAIKVYEEALKMKPTDGSVKRQISQAKKNIAKQEANNQRYEQAIKEADAFFAQKNLSAAQQRYSEASKLNSSSAYPQEKIAEIKKIVAQQTAENQKREAQAAEYNNLIKQGNAALAAKNYPLAQQMFQKAGVVKPNDALATQKVAEAQQALKKQEEQQAENARIDKEYQAAIAAANASLAQGDYIKAQEHYQSAIALKPSEALPRQKLVEAQKLEAKKQADILANQKAEVERNYNEAIAKANGALSQKKYTDAIAAFEQAMLIKPSDSYAQQQIVKINNLIVEESQAKQAAIEQAYNQAIALGDAKKISKDFSQAVDAYKQALVAKPDDPLASAKLTEAQKLLADKERMEKEEQITRAQYTELIQQGDGLFKAKDFEGSKTKYAQALGLYSEEQYPRNKIAEIDNIIAKNQKEENYNSIIAAADNLFNQEQWEQAKAKYGEAQVVIPENNYPRQKINEINQKISGAAKAAIEQKYNDFASQAEQQVLQKNYEEAKSLYTQAQQVIPENPYPQQRINEINQMIDDDALQAKRDNYNNFVSQGDTYFNNKEYDQARSAYNQALQVIPAETYPQTKINEINQKISGEAKAATEQKYNDLSAQAEQQIAQKNYEEAKSLYSQAQQVMPENPYPQQRINEINQMIDNDAIQVKRDNYNNFVNKADTYFNNKEYDQARSAYNQALQVIPTETYPQTKINEISQLVSNNARQKTVDEYNAIIANADQLLASKNYSEAISAYQKAISVMPEQTYPQQKLNEISAILTEQARLEASKGEVEAKYNQTIALADKYFNDKNYPLATSEYKKSLTIKPGEQYPNQQIQKINQLIAEQQMQNEKQQELERKYKESIAKADLEFKSRDYQNAKVSYNEALSYKPNDIHANSQLERIDQLFAEKASVEEKQKQKEGKYNGIITSADHLYSANKLVDAKKTYLSALEVMPGQEYPRSQIRKIDEKMRIIAANKAAVKVVTPKTTSQAVATTKVAATSAITGSSKKLTDLSSKSNSERQKYLEDLKAKYNKGITKEVYATNNSTTNRYIVIRDEEVKEFRETVFKWGGTQYRVNGKPTNSFYLKSQVKPRNGESFKEVKM